jgi:hypothetical protein
LEMAIGQASEVRYRVTKISETRDRQRFRVQVTNARHAPANVEIEIPFELRGNPKGIAKIDGVPTWKTTIPGNGDAELFY